MVDHIEMQNTDEYKTLYASLSKIENDRVRKMTACKQYYKLYPDTVKPNKRITKPKQNYDSLSYLQELHGDMLPELITKSNDDKYSVNFKTGKIIKKRVSKSQQSVDDVDKLIPVDETKAVVDESLVDLELPEKKE